MVLLRFEKFMFKSNILYIALFGLILISDLKPENRIQRKTPPVASLIKNNSSVYNYTPLKASCLSSLFPGNCLCEDNCSLGKIVVYSVYFCRNLKIVDIEYDCDNFNLFKRRRSPPGNLFTLLYHKNIY